MLLVQNTFGKNTCSVFRLMHFCGTGLLYLQVRILKKSNVATNNITMTMMQTTGGTSTMVLSDWM